MQLRLEANDPPKELGPPAVVLVWRGDGGDEVKVGVSESG